MAERLSDITLVFFFFAAPCFSSLRTLCFQPADGGRVFVKNRPTKI